MAGTGGIPASAERFHASSRRSPLSRNCESARAALAATPGLDCVCLPLAIREAFRNLEYNRLSGTLPPEVIGLQRLYNLYALFSTAFPAPRSLIFAGMCGTGI